MYSATKVAVQDKVSQESEGRTMYCTVVEGALNCLGINRDSTQVVVAGRNVFKIFRIEENEFVERANLRVGKNLNLNFSASDVCWNPIEDHIIASAATNGAVVLWDLNKTSRSKQELVFQEHKRTVNKVSFHGSEGNILISGSQDGSMKLFDLRKQEVSSTFVGRSESVRDVQFCPHHYFLLAAAYENGNIQLWDMRNPSRWERQFTAHTGPTFSIDWHPEDKNWIASGGRDKLIKVWDLQKGYSKNIHTVQTIASVARIKWRPQCRYHIASCALLVDCNINVWDIRRPYIPFAAFSEHKDVVTGIAWKHGDPYVFLSSGKDYTLYQHMFRDATRPADNVNPVGVNINIGGSIVMASSDKLAPGTGVRGSSYSSTKLPLFFRRQPDRSEQFTMVSSSLTEFANRDENLTMDWFIWCAKNYRLSGLPLEDLCEHNSQVAQQIGRHQIAQTWNMLKLLYATSPATPAQGTKTISNKGDKMILDGEVDRGKHNLDKCHMPDIKAQENDIEKDTSTGMSEEESDVQEAEHSANLTSIASGLGSKSHSDFFFGDGEVDQTGFEYEPLENITNGQDWSLPNEAFQLRHEIKYGSQDPLGPQPNGQESPSSATESDFTNKVSSLARESNIKEEILSVPTFTSQMFAWQFKDLVCAMLHYYAEQGDVQMAASVLIVLGDKIRQEVDELEQEQWFISYIDLLGRFQLWTVATEVIKLSNHNIVESLNLQSTTIHTSCGRCLKPLIRSGWLCDRCINSVQTCSICHLPVKGLYVWCQGCSHGGHLNHMKQWLAANRQCPAGCGHLCELT